MQHGKIIILQVYGVIHYADSSVIFHCQMINIFYEVFTHATLC